MLYLILLVMILIFTGCTEQVKMDIAGTGETIPTGVNAVTWDGKNFIVAKEGLIVFLDNIETATAGSIYKYEGHYFFDKYPITLTSKENPPYITGLAWQKTSDTGFIWVTDAANKIILKITPDGKVVRKIPSVAVYPDDITFDGEYLWIIDSKRGRIFKVSTEDGSAIAEYLSPVSMPMALAWDGKNLIIAGLKDFNTPLYSSDNVKIVKLNPESGKVIEEILNTRYVSYPSAMVWVNGKLWICDKNSGYLIKIGDRGILSEDTKNYKLTTVTPVFKKIELKKEKKEAEKETEEAKKAAEEARKAAEEAKRAAEAAKKAFELQQKK
uniref:Uncharacterized protein n=1 Tax=Thermodesulfovibrio aggregans TaxID=86166 RepID=A0A7C4AJ91_9BACT